MSSAGAGLKANRGSFRDPVNRVYEVEASSANGKPRILRGVTAEALANYQQLESQAFYRKAVERGQIVQTSLLSADDADAEAVLAAARDL